MPNGAFRVMIPSRGEKMGFPTYDKHVRAMDLAFMGDRALSLGDRDRARDLFGQAFRLEIEVADMFRDRHGAEPTRSILFISAASLALQAGLDGEAAACARAGLDGEPSPENREWLEKFLENRER